MNTNRISDSQRSTHQGTVERVLMTRLTRRALCQRLAAAGAGIVSLGAPSLISAHRAPRNPTRPASAFSAGVATSWFDLMLHLVETTPGFTPPVASRAFGYAGVALYEALLPGMRGYRTLAGQLSELEPLRPPADPAYHWPAVANSGLAAITRRLFPTTSEANHAAIDALERDLVGSFVAVPKGILQRSVRRGRAVAGHIFDWSRTDGGHEGYLRNFPEDYEPPTGEGLWVPTPPAYAPALQPTWGSNRTFAIGDPAAIPVAPPPPFATAPDSIFYQSAYEVYEAVNQLTPEQEAIARFWADDPGTTPTPPGHSIAILNQVIEQEGVDLARAAEAYARVGLAVADAFICCWHTKYTFNLLRPITYVRAHIDPAWGDPLPVTTPPFPEYTSGHSVQSGAAAQVLTDLFGGLAFTDHTPDVRGMAPRAFPSFFAFAAEAAISRLYGGIHFREAIELGLEQGIRVGEKVSSLRFTKD